MLLGSFPESYHEASKLSFPGFITGFVQSQGVQIAGPFTEQLVGLIDDRFLKGLPRTVAKKLSAPSSGIPHPEPEHEPEPEIPQQEQPQHPGCNALFIFLIILLENIIYYYILYDFGDYATYL